MSGVTVFKLLWNEKLDRVEAKFEKKHGGAKNWMTLVDSVAEIIEAMESPAEPAIRPDRTMRLGQGARVQMTAEHCRKVLDAIHADEDCAPALERRSLKIVLGRKAKAKIEEAREAASTAEVGLAPPAEPVATAPAALESDPEFDSIAAEIDALAKRPGNKERASTRDEPAATPAPDLPTEPEAEAPGLDAPDDDQPLPGDRALPELAHAHEEAAPA
jgi:hypothetical protein